MWLRIYQHLLPQAQAWRITVAKTLRRFFEGLTGLPADARQYIDDVHDDLYPDVTRQLAEWETQFGLTPSAGATDADRRAHLDGAWKAQGGQSPRYLQDVVQAAGFPLYIHEWWDPSALPTVTARDPHTYTHQPLIGEYVCKPAAMPAWVCKAQTIAGIPQSQAVCTNWLNNETNYIVNLNLTRAAPPPIPTDASLTPAPGSKYPFFLTWCGATYGTFVNIPAARRNELEALLKKLCPAQDWLVVLAHYV
jgi:hypothetical protein